MSFGPPPPTTPYGDSDFFKEDVTPQQYPLSPPPSSKANQNLRAYPAYSAPPPAQSPYGQLVPTIQRPLVQLTPEDILFLHRWRSDSYIFGVLPLQTIAYFALYHYNYKRKLPHKLTHYAILSAASYIIGKWYYAGEMKKRLEKSPSNTFFMNSLRKVMGVGGSSTDEFSGDTNQGFSGGLYNRDQPVGWGSSDVNTGEGAFPRRPPGPQTNYEEPTGYGQYSQGVQEPAYQPYEPDFSSHGPQSSGEQPKPVHSYEELRARNRGLLQK